MGNQHGKENVNSPLTADELKVIESSFRATGAHSEKLTKEKLLQNWSEIIDSHLAKCTSDYLFNSDGSPPPAISFRRYSEPYYLVECGTINEKLKFLIGSLAASDVDEYALKEMENYVTSVVKSYLNMNILEHNDAYGSWKMHGYQSSERSILAFSKGIIRSIIKNNEHYVDMSQLERWLQTNPTFLIMWREVFSYLYSKNVGNKSLKLGASPTVHILPVLEGLPTGTNYTPILDIPHVIFVNSNLPMEYRHKWRFLFSSKIMGESFSTMLGKVIFKGPTVIVVEDEDRHIFGGYAPETWALRPNFVGDDSSMLFTLSPAMRIFNSTGYNEHYQYLNINQQTMPNGLGMGGQFNYWGLWIDSEYGVGHSSESCTTYRDYVQLSKRKDFRIFNLEVWAVGDEPKDEVDSDEELAQNRSVLDEHLSDRVMLELAGKKMHSDGLRDPDLDL